MWGLITYSTLFVWLSFAAQLSKLLQTVETIYSAWGHRRKPSSLPSFWKCLLSKVLRQPGCEAFRPAEESHLVLVATAGPCSENQFVKFSMLSLWPYQQPNPPTEVDKQDHQKYTHFVEKQTPPPSPLQKSEKKMFWILLWETTSLVFLEDWSLERSKQWMKWCPGWTSPRLRSSRRRGWVQQRVMEGESSPVVNGFFSSWEHRCWVIFFLNLRMDLIESGVGALTRWLFSFWKIPLEVVSLISYLEALLRDSHFWSQKNPHLHPHRSTKSSWARTTTPRKVRTTVAWPTNLWSFNSASSSEIA